MSNFDKLKEMTPAEAADVILWVSRVQGLNYADIEGWLNSDQEEMVYKGKPGIITMGNEKRACTVVDHKEMMGKPYTVVICDGKIYSSPSIKVKEK